MAIFGLGKKQTTTKLATFPLARPSSDVERRAIEIGKELLAPAGASREHFLH